MKHYDTQFTLDQIVAQGFVVARIVLVEEVFMLHRDPCCGHTLYVPHADLARRAMAQWPRAKFVGDCSDGTGVAKPIGAAT